MHVLQNIIKNETIYYESSDNFGSGRSGVVNQENTYTTIPCYAGINGYAFLDENGNVLDSDYIESENDIAIPEHPEGAVKLFKHFHSTSYRNGWIDSENVVLNKDETQKPEEIVEEINKAVQNEEQKTAIVIDFSGSMSDNQRQVVELLGTLKFKESTKIIVFADSFKIVSHEELINKKFNVGSETHMMQALNEALSLKTENMIIISDLATYKDVSLEESETLKSVVIYDPDDGTEDAVVEDVLRKKWDKTEIKRVKIS